MKNNKIVWIIGCGGLLILSCCLALVILGAAGIFSAGNFIQENNPVEIFPEINPFEGGSVEDLGEDAEIVVATEDEYQLAIENLETLENTLVPIRDLNDLAIRLGGVTVDIPSAKEPTDIYYQIGDERVFWVSNVDTYDTFQTTATLEYVTDHAYFWFENGVDVDQSALAALADEFENNIYVTNHEFFGSEWSPGVDGDPHIYLLFATNLGASVYGFFSSSDEVSPLAHEYSNTAEMFYLNADYLTPDNPETPSVLAHEFQHMIHWAQDRNETSWVNEGFSMLASQLNGFSAGGHDSIFIYTPDHQLNDWPNGEISTTPYYGAAYLFSAYMLDRLGEENTRAVVASPENGMTSIDGVLVDSPIYDSIRGENLTADDIVQDWVLANYLKDGSIADGRFTYYNYADSPQAYETETISDCGGDFTRDVSQYGADYIRITCSGNHTINFEGSPLVNLLPTSAYSGDYVIWSNKGDLSDMTMTREFDFSDVRGEIQMNFSTWYDIEEGWDYVYLVISEDNGKSWEIQTTQTGTALDPYGNGYGFGWSDASNGWIEETVNLSAFTGEKVLVRFEYVTDDAVNGEGMLIDNISVPAVDYFSDFESDTGGWELAGFERISFSLPQSFRLSLVLTGFDPNDTEVIYIPLNENNLASVSFEIGDQYSEATFVVTGTTRMTRQKATYGFSITP
ncbi:MAG: immune inhibitor A [Anaerolineales bacterium]|nr:immune inhibitor A [Anaerolineales bacterium]